MLTMSDLPQQAFDNIAHAVALLSLMDNAEIEHIAASLEHPSMSDSAAMRASMQHLAAVIRSFKEE